MSAEHLDHLVASNNLKLWPDSAYSRHLSTFGELLSFVQSELSEFRRIGLSDHGPTRKLADIASQLEQMRSASGGSETRQMMMAVANKLREIPYPTFSPVVKLLAELSADQRRGALDLLNGEANGLHTRERFEGAIAMAIVAKPELFQRSATAYVDSWKAQTKGLADERNQSFESLAQLRKLDDEWREQQREKFNELYNSADTRQNELFESHSTRSSKLLSENQIEFDKLIKRYRDQLALEAPIAYWKKMQESYEKKRRIWAGLVIAILSSFIGGGISLIYYPPEYLLKPLTDPGGVRLSLITLTIVSLGIFSITTAVRFATSATHLARDAKEREQLTMVYLALREKGDISEDERKIVFNSLFARAETGLLKGDGTPAMAGIAGLLESGASGKH